MGSSKKQRFVVVDGSGLMWRAYHRRNPPRRSPLGNKTESIHAYCTLLAELLRMLQPDYLLVALDVARDTTFRRDLDPQYKAQRTKLVGSEGISAYGQLAQMESLTRAFGVTTLRVEGFEADDVIASVVEVCASDEVECVVVSGDHDLQQVVGPNCCVYDFFKDIYHTETTVLRKWGVLAAQIEEVMTLMGDSGDNVPGVPGIGPKLATKAIQDYGTVARALESASLWASTKVQMALATTDMGLCRKLVALRRDVPLDLDPVGLEFDGLDFQNGASNLLRLGLRASY